MADHIEIAPDFIYLADRDIRDKALTMPLGTVAKSICTSFEKQADASRYIDQMIELIEPIAREDDDRVVAGLNAINLWLSQWYKEMYHMAGLSEALMLRLDKAAAAGPDMPNKGGAA